jgi:aspartate aminotransferase-like enzyme
VRRLAEEHGLFVCPNGGALGRRIFRVGHLGALTPDHNARLAGALTSISMEPAAGGIRKGTPS